MNTLNELSSHFFKKMAHESKENGEAPDWWKGSTTLSVNAVEEFENKQKELQHHRDTTVGLWALDRDPKNLLHEFWQRSSDACPLEASEAEKQEKEFQEFVEKLSFQIK